MKDIVSPIVVITIVWWLVFFMLLPIGVKTPGEAGESAPEGTPESAPVNPGIKWKIIVASIASLIGWGLFWLIRTYELISLRPH